MRDAEPRPVGPHLLAWAVGMVVPVVHFAATAPGRVKLTPWSLVFMFVWLLPYASFLCAVSVFVDRRLRRFPPLFRLVLAPAGGAAFSLFTLLALWWIIDRPDPGALLELETWTSSPAWCGALAVGTAQLAALCSAWSRWG